MSVSVNMVLVWLVIFGVCLAIEIATLGLATIWFAVGALASLGVAAAGGSLTIQIIVFTIVSLLLLFAVRPIASRYLNGNRAKTNVENVIGKTAIVTETINNLEGTGRVQLAGQDWMARSGNDTVLAVDRKVTVKEVQGVKLIVEAAQS